MSTSSLQLGRIRQLWRLALTAAFVVGMLAPPLSAAHATEVKVGLVYADPSGASDKGFNYMAKLGLDDAVTDLGITGTAYTPASTSYDDYVAKLEQCVSDGNELCFGVGIGMADAMLHVAGETGNESIHFAIVDFSAETYPANLRGLIFVDQQSGYLAGALAAKMSGGTVGVIGGMQQAAVRKFVDGFRNGAQCAGTGINVLWTYTGSFAADGSGAAAATDMIARGASVIFGVGGANGVEAIQYSATHNVLSIGVDADQWMSVFGSGTVDGSDYVLTSAMKRVDTAVHETIEDQINGTFTSGDKVYGLNSGGVGLAPYHEVTVPEAIDTYMNGVKDGLQDGTIDFTYGCRPRFHAEVVENDVMGFDWVPTKSITLSIDDDPVAEPNPLFSDVQVVNDQGVVAFTNLGTVQLAPGMHIRMEGDVGQMLGIVTKELDVSTLEVTKVDLGTDTVWGIGPAGVWLNIQRCDAVGCSWRRFTTVSSLGGWAVAFSIPGGESPEEMNTLDIVPGMHGGEALQPDSDGDHTDYRWDGTEQISGNAGVAGATLAYTDGTAKTATTDANGNYSFNVSYNWGATTAVTVTPAKSGCTFSPTNKSYAHLRADKSGENYTATCMFTYQSLPADDGWVLESTENSGVGGSLNAGATNFNLGDDPAKKQYRGILSFNTSNLPDAAIITNATLKIRKQAIAGGGNPFSIFQGMYVDVRKGFFSTASALQNGDFQAAASKTVGPFNPAPASLYTIALPSAAYPYINKLAAGGGLTQLRLRFKLDDNNNTIANYISFYSGNAPAANRPVLTITFHAP